MEMSGALYEMKKWGRKRLARKGLPTAMLAT
jgi:hypothetical protein